MKESSFIVLKSILDTNQSFERLSKFLSNDHLKKINACDIAKTFDYRYFSAEKLLDFIHYSWLIPTLKNIENDINFCIFALPLKVQEKLKEQFKLDDKKYNLSYNAKEYIQLIFLNSLLGSDDTILPIEYLPYSPLNILVKKDKQTLLRIIDFLALFDLALQLRKTLNTNTIKMIYTFLRPDEKKFLTKTQSLKDHLSFSSLLDKWDGSEKSFRKLLHKRGLYRFGLALSHSHPDLIWYLCHILDIGRGSSLMKMCEKKVNPVISNAVQSHILEILAII